MDCAGRRILLGVGYVVAGLFCILMTVSLNLQNVVSWMPYMSVVSVVGFIVGFAIGPGKQAARTRFIYFFTVVFFC